MGEMTTVREDTCAAGWCAGDDWCPVTCAMDVLGGKWHPAIVHRLLRHGTLRFTELGDELDPITNTTLSRSLDGLEADGLVHRKIVNEKPIEVEYSLTERGQSLRPVIESLEAWGRTHLGSGGDDADRVC